MLPTIALLALLPSIAATGDDIIFPPDGGIVNVKDHGAKGDGRADDTAAIQRALDAFPNAGAIIYLPAGTYLISDTVRWPHGDRGGMEEKNTILQGQGRDRTTIRLKDGADGYNDPRARKPMIRTGERPAQRFRNAVRDLTIDTGRRNPGASALQFIANNQGCVRDVTLRAGDGKSAVGLDMAYTDEVGPLLVKNLRVVGFDFGIRTSHVVDSMTFEGITLENQNRFGWANEGQCVSVRGLTSRNAVPAILNERGPGLITLLDARLIGTRGASAWPAVANKATLFARNVTQTGYVEAIHNAAGSERASDRSKVDEFVAGPVLSLFPTAPRSLGLPVEETPEVPWDPLDRWASPTHFGAKPDDDEDDTAAIQSAIDSGKTTVYLPRGRFKLGGTLHVRGKVRRLIGLEASLVGEGTIRVEGGESPVVLLERFRISYAPIAIEQATTRTLVIRDAITADFRGEGGRLFLEDVCGGPFRFARQSVWARQLNAESPTTKVVNDGGTLWILGYKTEREGTLIETTGGGRTELLGGFAYATSGPKEAPMFVVGEGSDATFTIGESCFNGNPFQALVRQTSAGVTKDLGRDEAPRRAAGSLIPLFVGRGKGQGR